MTQCFPYSVPTTGGGVNCNNSECIFLPVMDHACDGIAGRIIPERAHSAATISGPDDGPTIRAHILGPPTGDPTVGTRMGGHTFQAHEMAMPNATAEAPSDSMRRHVQIR